MLSAGFEPAMPAIKELQTYVIDRTVTGISLAVLGRYLFPSNKLAGALILELTSILYRD
jgi:hypothetical protein